MQGPQALKKWLPLTTFAVSLTMPQRSGILLIRLVKAEKLVAKIRCSQECRGIKLGLSLVSLCPN